MDKKEELETERREIISKIKDLEINYSSVNLQDEEYEELKTPLKEKVTKIDGQLKKFSDKASEDSTYLNKEDKKESKTNYWSIIILLLISGIFGVLIFAFMGYFVTKTIKFIFPKTMRVEFNSVGFWNYGWRGVGVVAIAIMIFYLVLILVLLFSNEPIENDILSNILRVVYLCILLVFCYAGIKQFEPSENT